MPKAETSKPTKPDPKKPPEICPTCKKEVKGNGVAALGHTYHPNHFVCIKCNNQIIDKFQVDKDNNPYCPECSIKFLGMKVEICSVCNKEIEGKAIKTLGKVFHPEHFTCTKCKKRIESKYQVHEDKPYCEECFNSSFVEKCSKCGKPLADQVVKAGGKNYHVGCFLCDFCKKKLTETPFKEMDGKLICENCFMEKFAEKCKKCKKALKGEIVEAIGGQWHEECFVCIKCGAKITADFLIEKDMPVCMKCSQKK